MSGHKHARLAGGMELGGAMRKDRCANRRDSPISWREPGGDT